ncbi:MAG: hypothetical protein CFE45_12385, partial [Burkholderiales bacterium PBB5]
GVSLDLNGHTVQGPQVCTNSVGVGFQCSGAAGSENGIYVDAQMNGPTIRNGVVTGFGGQAVTVFQGAIESVTASHSGLGFALGWYQAGTAVHARDITAYWNAGPGIYLDIGMVDGAVAYANKSEGVTTGSSSHMAIVSNAHVSYNGGAGLKGVAVRSATAYGNKGGNAVSVKSFGGNLNNGTAF